MPKKRSLKDAATDHLVEKNVTPPPVSTPSRARPPLAAATKAKTSQAPQVPAADPNPAPPSQLPAVRAPQRSLLRMAFSILVGFIGGFFFGRFIKII